LSALASFVSKALLRASHFSSLFFNCSLIDNISSLVSCWNSSLCFFKFLNSARISERTYPWIPVFVLSCCFAGLLRLSSLILRECVLLVSYYFSLICATCCSSVRTLLLA
jgi:hypothetical protein